MRLRYIILPIFTLALFLSACNKFLEVKPKGIVIPEKLKDYELMLSSREMNFSYSTVMLQIADEYYEEFDDLSTVPAANAYYWRPVIDRNDSDNPAVWGEMYNTIYHANVIINNVLNTKDGTDALRQSVLGEALVIRADCYFNMLLLFAKAYDPATAATDPGLPLVSSTNVTDKVPARSSVQVTLDSMINGVTRSIPALPLTNIVRHRATKYAAYGLLARIYLYMHNFDEAGKYAGLALTGPHTLLNYNNYAKVGDFPSMDVHPEVLLQRGSLDYMLPGNAKVQKELKDLYEPSDLRGTLLYREVPVGSGYYFYNESPGWFSFGSTYPEMYLTKAEALARKDQPAAAMDVLNMLRRNRIVTANYIPLSATDKEDALKKILLDRRKELAFRGQRWMDMKRLDQEGRMPRVERKVRGTGVVKATLEPKSKQYVFQIPARVQQFNPGMQLNDR